MIIGLRLRQKQSFVTSVTRLNSFPKRKAIRDSPSADSESCPLSSLRWGSWTSCLPLPTWGTSSAHKKTLHIRSNCELK